MFRCQRKCRQFKSDYPLQYSRCDVMVASQSPKLFVAVRVRTPRPMVDSTGVRLGLISLGEWSDGLQRKGSNPLSTTRTMVSMV